MAKNKKFFTYKGLPLVRKDNTIYFGNMYDDYVVLIEILETKKQGKIDVANKVRLRKMATDPTKVDPSKVVEKIAERESLYDALDMACAWLKV